MLALLACISVAQSLFYVDVRHRWGSSRLLGIFLAAAVRWAVVAGAGRGRPLDGGAGPA